MGMGIEGAGEFKNACEPNRRGRRRLCVAFDDGGGA